MRAWERRKRGGRVTALLDELTVRLERGVCR